MQSNPVAAMAPPAQTSRTPSATLGKDDFLKVLVAEMQHMDPLAAGDSKESIAQMAQFSMLEQIQNLQKSTERLGAMSMLGKTAVYTKSDGTVAEGTIESIATTESGRVTFTIDGEPNVALSAVSEVR